MKFRTKLYICNYSEFNSTPKTVVQQMQTIGNLIFTFQMNALQNTFY